MLSKSVLRSFLARNPALWTRGLRARRSVNRLLRRPFDGDFRALMGFRRAPGRVLLDIGSNIGEAIEAMRLYLPDAEIHGFEPRAATFAELSGACGALPGVTLHHCALGEAEGELTLYTPTYRGVAFDAIASTIREEAEQWMARFARGPAGSVEVAIAEEQTEVRTVDSLGLVPAFVKLDVQGAEGRVLRGGLRTIAAHLPPLMVERSDLDGVSEILGPLGYRPFRFDGRALRTGAGTGANVFFLAPANRDAFACEVDPFPAG